MNVIRFYSKKVKGKKSYLLAPPKSSKLQKPKLLESNKNATKTITKNDQSNDTDKSTNFIPFDKFPKIPSEFEKFSTNELYEKIYMKPINNNLINFEIPQEYSKIFIKSQLTPKDKALIEQLDSFMTSNDENERAQNQINMMKLYYDKDSFNYKSVPEHSLKKSLSGMINLNPHLDDIDDEYLWELIPQDKLFGKPFFEKKDNSEKDFKNWEISMINKNEKLINEIKSDNDEINNFIAKFNENNKSFYKKVNGRFKLNRELYRDYKTLKQKGKLIILRGEKSIDFDIEFENQNLDLKLKK
ncbi:hypothetical protein CLIB1444_10S04126 [[Candida] jaroonii]|uniref:Uncharacterized protein n=1 Tax=[Candida] jaroonii TaxID=467808 RepID=A0ACA9YC85_9ASCO|nr:hypothetical protein CLIB1444_10S04126 [[Candida] jaroonii]